ncbi:MAG: GGDEF domain-containing protein, partial [Ruthenibacterium sp.]
QARDELLLQSQRDSMTGLLNKGTIEQEIRKQLSAAQPEQQYALLLIDIDDFKKINDSLGHISGDRVLCEIAARMQTIFPRKALIGRAGGDEFLVFLSYADKRTEIIAAAERLIVQLRENISIAQTEYQVGVSVGIACYPDDGTRFYDLFRRADSALYRAKELGKNTCCLAAK